MNTSAASGSRHCIRAIVADDHPIVRAGIVHALAHQPDIQVIGETSDGDGALELVCAQRPDILLMDLSMPGREADEVTRQVRSLAAPTRVIVLTAHTELHWVMTMLQAGASAYVLKDEALETLVNAIRVVNAGGVWVSATVMPSMVEAVAGLQVCQTLLTGREQEVLAELVEGKENQEIARALQMSERTVRFHLRNIYDKIGVQRRAAAIAWGIRHGWGRSRICA